MWICPERWQIIIKITIKLRKNKTIHTKLRLLHQQKKGEMERLKPSPIACGLHKNNTGNRMKRQTPSGKKISLGFQTSHKTSLISDKPASQEPKGIFAFDYFGMIWQQMAMEGRTGRRQERQELKTRPLGWRGADLSSLSLSLSPSDLHPAEKHKARAVEHLPVQQINMAWLI